MLNVCLISDIRPGAIIDLAVVALRLAKPIQFVIDSPHLFPSSIVPLFSFNIILSLALTIPFAIAITML